MKRAVGILVVLALVAGIGWRVVAKLSARTGAKDRKGNAVVAVETAPIRRAVIRNVAEFTGDLLARSEFIVAPKVAGRLVKLYVDIGDSIENDQLIAVLDDEEYNQQVEQAKAELEVAKASIEESRSIMDTAQRELDRVETLRAKKIASESELDESRSQFRTAQSRYKVSLAQVAQKEAALKTAEVRESYTKIHASWTGGSDTRLIGERFADTGAMLKANDPIVSVVDIAHLTAVIYVTERDYAQVKVGQKVDVSCDAYPNRPFVGEVIRVAPLVKQTSREARVEVKVDNSEKMLRPGMFIQARIELARHENATVVPEAAIVKRQNEAGVFLPAGKKAKFVPVKAGFREGLLVEVTDPPLSGRVITMGQHLLENGTNITIGDGDQESGTEVASSEGPGTSEQQKRRQGDKETRSNNKGEGTADKAKLSTAKAAAEGKS